MHACDVRTLVCLGDQVRFWLDQPDVCLLHLPSLSVTPLPLYPVRKFLWVDVKSMS